MDLEELRAFLHVVESGSFLAAADSLGVSRTTLRRRVGSLEARAGVPLLESTQQGVILTDAGQTLARRGRAMVQEASALLASIREIGQSPSGVLRVSLPVGLPPQLLIPMFAAVREAYPLLHVHLSFSNDPLGESLGDIDMAVHFGETRPKGKWLSHQVLRLPVRLLASRGYLARRGTPASIDELASHELIAWQAPGEDARVWPTLRGTTFEVDPVLISTDIHIARRACIAGLGIALVPDPNLEDEVPPADIVVHVLRYLVGRELAVRIAVPEALAELPKIKMVLERVRPFIEPLA